MQGHTEAYVDADSEIREVTVDSFEAFAKKFIVISFQMDDEIWLTWALTDDYIFSDPILVSDGTATSGEPDIYTTPDSYAHFAWAVKQQELGDIDDYDVHYRRGELLETD